MQVFENMSDIEAVYDAFAASKLYQEMLEDAIAKIKSGQMEGLTDEGSWSPQINLGVPVLIPEVYVPDLDVRLGLYRRLSSLSKKRGMA